MSRREECVVVNRTNGAYLIQYVGENSEDMTTDEVTDAAGSLDRAKRVAREMAAGAGYGPAWRWHPSDTGLSWWLEARWLDPEPEGDIAY